MNLLNDHILDSALEKLALKVPRALLVGGGVRDLLLGLNVKDADVEVYGIGPDDLEKTLHELFEHVDLVGASFGIYKITLEEGRMLDVAIPRTESKTGKGHKGFAVMGDPELQVTDALRRRDFTMNAMALDLSTNEIIDPFHGRDDIQKKMLRVVDENTFRDDPLRVFRGVQFAARFGLTVEQSTFALMKKMVEEGYLTELSKERVTDEWKKLLLKSPRPSMGLELLLRLDVVHHEYPELATLIGTPQEKEWHPEGDVWTHTLQVLDECARLIRKSADAWVGHNALTAMLGALCHDLGKPLVTTMIDGKLRSFGHEEAGVEPTKSFLKRFTFGDDITHDVVAIVRDHLKPTVFYRAFQKGELNEKQYANAVRRLIKRLGGTAVDAFLAVTEADTRGRGTVGATGMYDPGDFMRSAMKKWNLEQSAKTPLLTGAELISEFGLVEGPKIGEVMKAVEAARDEGTIVTSEDARTFVTALLKNR